jgi:hypothetical protein
MHHALVCGSDACACAIVRARRRAAGIWCNALGPPFHRVCVPVLRTVLRWPHNPCSAPAAPTDAFAIADIGAALVSWTPPLHASPPITSFVLSAFVNGSSTGVSSTALAPASAANVSSLTPGVAYSFSVTAVNANGIPSPPSALSNTITPCTSADSVPSAPLSVASVPGVGSVMAVWTPPPRSPCWVGPVVWWNVTMTAAGVALPTAVSWLVLPASVTNWTLGNLSRAAGYSYSFQVCVCG